MGENEIKLRSVNDITGMNFFIPDYQRGYRWTKQQVLDLLNDINEFDDSRGSFYCLQPLVVKQREEDIFRNIKEKAENIDDVKRFLQGSWEVIDGQQRLTTIFIILKYLTGEIPFTLEYMTRPESRTFLEKLPVNDRAKKNIDFFHIFNTWETVDTWVKKTFTDDNEIKKNEFLHKILHSLKFIWYRSQDENAIKVFTRLNIGKIGLTNAELIRALILNSNNFDRNSFYLMQQQIALEWDKIEYTMQDDEFWLFLNSIYETKPTRIDLVFEIISASDRLGLSKRDRYEEIKLNIGNDQYSTFRYFYEYFRGGNGDIRECWNQVKNLFHTFSEWFSDLQLYHYIGFLVEYGVSLETLLSEWEKPDKDKNMFIAFLKAEISKKLQNCRELTTVYDMENSYKKTVCKPLLLLHNIQTVINQTLQNDKDYGSQVFYKFPFHIYKKEKWDVEHIDSNTENALDSEHDKKEWLRYSLLETDMPDDIKREILNYLKKPDGSFTEIYKKVNSIIPQVNSLDDREKNMIWNFVLLDAHTNRGYGNALFPVKRRCIIGKDQGRKYEVGINTDKEGEITPEIKTTASSSSFIPPCTKYSFLKYYNPDSASIKYWDKSDAKAYRENIKETLGKDFGVTINENKNDEK